jgi:hypothetical protein
VRQNEVELRSPQPIVEVCQRAEMRHPDDIDHAANGTMRPGGRKDALDLASLGDVGGVRDAVDLTRHGACTRLVAIDAHHLCTSLGEGVTGLPPDPVAAAEDDHDTACEAI